MLEKIRREGITTLVSTPYMDEAARCDRIALMQKGRILDMLKPSDPVREKYPLYSLRSPGGVYRYLEDIRSMGVCRSAWLFGDELHVTLAAEGEEQTMLRKLGTMQDPALEWARIKPSIEDRFMELMLENEGDPSVPAA